MKRSIKYWFGKVFARDVDLEKNAFLYLFFSFLAITFIIEYLILKYFIYMEAGKEREIPTLILFFVISISFLASGFLVDIIKDKTSLYIINLPISIMGLILTVYPYLIISIIGLLIVVMTIPQLIVVWYSTLVHETNMLNRGRVTAILLISCFLLGLLGSFFVIFEDLFMYLIIIEYILLIVIICYSRTYKYIETEERVQSDKQYSKIIFEKHFLRYSMAFTFLSGLLGGLFNDTLDFFGRYEIDIFTFAIVSFFYILAAGWFFDNLGRKNTLVIGILIVSFFYISHGSFYIEEFKNNPDFLIFGIPPKIHISIHYAFAVLPLILAMITISGDFSTERGNLKYRGRINGLYTSLMFFGLAVGYSVFGLIDILYANTNMRQWLPNFPNLVNSFVLVIVLVWMMAGKDILISKEREWAKTLKRLFILTKSGVCLYNYDFMRKFQPQENEKEEGFDEDLISGALSGVITILSEITRSKKRIKKIDKEGNHIYFSFGKHHIAVLIATMELPILSIKLDAFSGAFERRFSTDLKSFQGNVHRFLPTKYYVKRYFSQKYAEYP